MNESPAQSEVDGLSPVNLIAVLVTFNRPEQLLETIRAVGRQTLPPDVLLVVNNGQQFSTEYEALLRESAGIQTRVLVPGGNLGPAGGFHHGISAAIDAHPLFIVLIDDDDPPLDSTIFELLEASLRSRTDRVAGVGPAGARLNPFTGFAREASKIAETGLVSVDGLHGSFTPMYRASALRSVGSMDPLLFYGFEELELGRKLRAAGYDLVVDLDLWNKFGDRSPKSPATRPRRLSRIDPTLHRELKLRNLLAILWRDRAYSGWLVVFLIRGIAKPMFLSLRHPRLGLDLARQSIRAARGSIRLLPRPPAEVGRR